MSLLWRDSGKTVRFFGIDARAVAGLVLVLLHITMVTLSISIFLMVSFALLERFDYTLPNAARKFRVMISGRRKRATSPMTLRRYRSR